MGGSRAKRTALLCIGALFAAGLFTIETTALADPQGETLEDEVGNRMYYGEPSARVSDINDILAPLIDARPELYAGYSFTSDSQRLEIYVTSAGLAHVENLRKSVGFDFDQYVKLTVVEHSRADLESAQAEVVAAVSASRATSGIFYNAEEGSIRVELPQGELQSTAGSGDPIGNKDGVSASVALIDDLEAIEAATSIPVTLVEGGDIKSYTNRHDDISPFNGGGASVGYSGGSSTGFCSLGFGVYVGGTNYILTAGHCDDTSFYNPNGDYSAPYSVSSMTKIGNTGTTSYPGNADIYGDFRLIRATGSTRVFNGGKTSTSYATVSGVQYSPRAEGSFLCASGAATNAEICRFRVIDRSGTVTIDGVARGHVMVTYHDSDLNGIGDCEGMTYGDSGGSVYYASSSRPGTVIANGIVLGGRGGVGITCRDYFTSLDGVREWNSSFVVKTG